MAAEDDDVLLEGEFVGDALVQDLAVGGHVDDLVVVSLGFQLLDHPEDRLHHHDHPGVSAVAVVIDVLARADAVFAEMMDVDFDQAFLDGAADDGVRQRALQKLRNYGQDIDSHGRSYILNYVLQK